MRRKAATVHHIIAATPGPDLARASAAPGDDTRGCWTYHCVSSQIRVLLDYVADVHICLHPRLMNLHLLVLMMENAVSYLYSAIAGAVL
jgi:hypothetical protein